MPPLEEMIKVAWLLAVSGFMGSIAYLNECIENKVKPKFYEWAVKTLGCVAAGMVTLYGCMACDASPGVTGALTALAGWMGAPLLKEMADVFRGSVRELKNKWLKK